MHTLNLRAGTLLVPTYKYSKLFPALSKKGLNNHSGFSTNFHVLTHIIFPFEKSAQQMLNWTTIKFLLNIYTSIIHNALCFI